MLRDGMHQTAVHAGVAPYRPNSLDGGNPSRADGDTRAFVDVPTVVETAPKTRQAPQSFADHTSQARMFWLSMSAVERDHIIQAFTFELGKCYETTIRERQLRVLADVDPELCAGVAAGLGLPAPEASRPLADVLPSPALSQLGRRWPTTGRTIGIVVDESTDPAEVRMVRDALFTGA
jgi:catalase